MHSARSCERQAGRALKSYDTICYLKSLFNMYEKARSPRKTRLSCSFLGYTVFETNPPLS